MHHQTPFSAAWYISPRQHERILASSDTISAHLRNVVSVASPRYDAATALASLASDVGFCLFFVHDFCNDGDGDDVLTPVWAEDFAASAAAPTDTKEHDNDKGQKHVQHTLACLSRFYNVTLSQRASSSSSTTTTDHVDALLARCAQHAPQSPSCHAGDDCPLVQGKLTDRLQVQGLMYLINLVTGCLLAQMTGCLAVEERLRDDVARAWPRIRAILNTGQDRPLCDDDDDDDDANLPFLAHL